MTGGAFTEGVDIDPESLVEDDLELAGEGLSRGLGIADRAEVQVMDGLVPVAFTAGDEVAQNASPGVVRL